MLTTVEPSPLLLPALAFMGEGMTAAGLVAAFGAAGATIDEPTAESLLGSLCAHGLARVTRVSTEDNRYRATTLGKRWLDSSLTGSTDHADLFVEIEHMRTELVTTIAHELRTPLTAIRTSVGLLLDPAVEPSAAQRQILLETIERNASRMQRVVSDIVDLTRFRTGRIQLQLRRIDATALARAAIASIAPLAESREQAIELSAPSEPVWVFCDYRRLEQTLVNLLSNAVNYSPEGAPIEVTVASSGTEISWTVSDEGPGIRPADQERLFERFFTVGGDRSEATNGIGLGLPISLSIVQAHDGRIDVLSELGGGSSFTVTVPAAGPTETPDE